MTYLSCERLFRGALIVLAMLVVTESSANPVCAESGGKMGCTSVVVLSDWSFGHCRVATFPGNNRIWCETLGGTWDANVGGCIGTLPPVTESNFLGLATAVELEWMSACSVSSTSSGWGATVSAVACPDGGTLTRGGIEYRKLQTVDFSSIGRDSNGACTQEGGTARYILEQTRNVDCPAGTTRVGDGDDVVCTFMLPYRGDDGDDPDGGPLPSGDSGNDGPNADGDGGPSSGPGNGGPDGSGRGEGGGKGNDAGDGGDSGNGSDPTCGGASSSASNSADSSGVGNPIDISLGVKRQVERDYRSTKFGGLEFKRYYNSAGHFSLTQGAVPGTEDYWRHTYSGRVVEIAGSSYVMAAVQDAAGFIRYYTPTGDELHNQGIGKSRLERLTTGGATTGWQQTTPSGRINAFDAQGRLASITTRSGFVHSLTYSAGRLDAVTDTYGHTITFGYDGSGKLASMTDPSGRVTQYGYDAGGRLSTVSRPDQTARTYVYEDTKWPFALTGVIDERGARLSTFGYAASNGRVISTERSGPQNRYTVQYNDGPTILTRTVTDAYNVGHSYSYSIMNGVPRMTSHVGPAGTISATYDAAGNIATKTDRRGYQTTYAFDSSKNLKTSQTTASGTSLARTITTTWHPTFNLPTQVTRPSGIPGVNLVTEYSYDASGNVTNLKHTAGSLIREWSLTVNNRGKVLTANGPRTDVNDVTTFTYFSETASCVGCRGQVATVTNALGQVTTFSSYNLDGRPLSVTDANAVTTTFAYNSHGWLSSTTRDGETTAYEYDAAGNLTRVIFADGSSNGPWPDGTFPYEKYNPHPGNANSSDVGTDFFGFSVPGRSDMGVHSGREGRTDLAGRSDFNYATNGCIRTTNDITDLIKGLHTGGDPLQSITVRR